jgi:hypothetical protein
VRLTQFPVTAERIYDALTGGSSER